LFFETSENIPKLDIFVKYLEELLKQVILNHLNSMIFSKTFNNVYYENYKKEILKIIKKSNNPKMVVFYNLSFGHNEPKHAIPYGLTAQIDPLTSQFSIDENSVIST